MKKPQYPPVVVVDESDNEIGTAPLSEVWKNGLYHRIVSIYVFDENKRILLQRRSAQVKMYPSYWDQAAGGHVDEGSTYDEAALNELAEELGIFNIPLQQMGTFRTNNILSDGRIINQFERVYIVTVSHLKKLKINTNEVMEVKWFSPEEIKDLVLHHSEELTPGLLIGLHQFFPEITPKNTNS